ncbi:MAG TPA: hypothetical protein VMZ06_13130 [Candidatus Bathyarchaeia archaeon]|nr:hypothetical protein [Candidatus Bathyarchaeia archaeon]
MTTKRLLACYICTLIVAGIPFTVIHLIARPDDAPISPLQHVVAAVANFFGPWGVAIVRLVDFPNAGMRAFSWTLAIGLTLLGALLVAVPVIVKNRFLQYAALIPWTAFLIVWFGIGLLQIPSGLL